MENEDEPSNGCYNVSSYDGTKMVSMHCIIEDSECEKIYLDSKKANAYVESRESDWRYNSRENNEGTYPMRVVTIRVTKRLLLDLLQLYNEQN